jgi:hypothetical protein
VHPEQLQGRLIELGVRALGGHRLGEVLELMEEFEEAVCVSFHVITFGRAADGKLGQRLKKRRIAPSAVIHTPKAHGRKAATPLLVMVPVAPALLGRRDRPISPAC